MTTIAPNIYQVISSNDVNDALNKHDNIIVMLFVDENCTKVNSLKKKFNATAHTFTNNLFLFIDVNNFTFDKSKPNSANMPIYLFFQKGKQLGVLLKHYDSIDDNIIYLQKMLLASEEMVKQEKDDQQNIQNTQNAQNAQNAQNTINSQIPHEIDLPSSESSFSSKTSKSSKSSKSNKFNKLNKMDGESNNIDNQIKELEKMTKIMELQKRFEDVKNQVSEMEDESH